MNSESTCEVYGYVGLIDVGGAQELVLGDMLARTKFLPQRNVLVREIAGDEDDATLSALVADLFPAWNGNRAPPGPSMSRSSSSTPSTNPLRSPRRNTYVWTSERAVPDRASSPPRSCTPADRGESHEQLDRKITSTPRKSTFPDGRHHLRSCRTPSTRSRGEGAPRVSTSSKPENHRTTAGQARNASGTKAFTDLLSSLIRRRPAKQPDEDLDDLRQGTTLFVSAFSRRGRRFKQGRLVLQSGAPDPAVWHPYRPFHGHGPGILLSQPYDLRTVGPVTGPGSWVVKRELFQLITLRAADQLWEFAVPTVDVELVRIAVSTASNRSD